MSEKILQQKTDARRNQQKEIKERAGPGAAGRLLLVATCSYKGRQFCGIFPVSTYFESPRSLKHCQALVLRGYRGKWLDMGHVNNCKNEEFLKRHNIEPTFYRNFSRTSPYIQDPKGSSKAYSTQVSSITKVRLRKF